MAQLRTLVLSADMSVMNVEKLIEFLKANGYLVDIVVDVHHRRFALTGPWQAITQAVLEVSRICPDGMKRASVGL